jgi:pantothenate kinase type III
MTAYADYAYYTDTYLGTAITTEAAFDALALRASAQIDRITFQRAASVIDEDDLDAIQMATCAIAEEIQTIAQEGSSGGIKSESVGQHSVTFAENNSMMFTDTQRYENVARIYLEGTDLLYKGFAAGEYSGTSSNDE